MRSCLSAWIAGQATPKDPKYKQEVLAGHSPSVPGGTRGMWHRGGDVLASLPDCLINTEGAPAHIGTMVPSPVPRPQTHPRKDPPPGMGAKKEEAPHQLQLRR